MSQISFKGGKKEANSENIAKKINFSSLMGLCSINTVNTKTLFSDIPSENYEQIFVYKESCEKEELFKSGYFSVIGAN